MFGGVLSNLANSLEGTIVDEVPTPFVDKPTPYVEQPVEDNSLRSQIIRNAIAKGKEAEIKQSHPLSGGLFDHLSNFQSTMGSDTPSIAPAPKPFMAPYVMVQQANSTKQLNEMSKNASSLQANNTIKLNELSKNVTKNVT